MVLVGLLTDAAVSRWREFGGACPFVLACEVAICCWAVCFRRGAVCAAAAQRFADRRACCVFQRCVPARAAGYALCVPDEKRVLRRPTNGCQLKKQSVARPCFLDLTAASGL